MIATGCGDNNIRIFREQPESDPHAPQFDLIYTGEEHEMDVNSVRWCPSQDGMLASASDDGTVKIWTLA
jgi:WD40 repeat protein